MKQDSGQVLPNAGATASVTEARAARRALGWAVAISLALAWLPDFLPALAWLAWPQVLASTLAHELGHGLAALVSGGGFDSLQLYADGSGVAHTRSAGGAMQRALIAAGGPLGPPLAALGLFLAARRAGAARAALALISLLLAFALVIWVRTAFGALWVGLCAALAGAAAWRASGAWVQALACLVAVQLCLSRLSRLGGLFSRTARTGAGELLSDTGQLADLLWAPHWFWGALIVLLSAAVMLTGVWAFFLALREDR